MAGNGRLSRNQERFLQALILGKSVVDSARFAAISERTAYRWLEDSVFQAERLRREQELAEAEQAEIQRILTSGYALMHRRVEALDRLAQKLEGYLEDENKVWLPDVKAIGTGKDAERVDLVTFNDALIREYRATFDDIAKELGQRVRKADVTSAGEKMVGPQIVFYLPEVDKEDENAGDSESSANS